MRNIHIENSYKIWNSSIMKDLISDKVAELSILDPELFLNRTFESMYLEWVLHNIGYYLTLPFIKNEYFNKLNNRLKHVDINEWR